MTKTTENKKVEDKNNAVIDAIKAKLFDKMRDLEKLQAYANKLTEERRQLLEQLEAAEKLNG